MSHQFDIYSAIVRASYHCSVMLNLISGHQIIAQFCTCHAADVMKLQLNLNHDEKIIGEMWFRQMFVSQHNAAGPSISISPVVSGYHCLSALLMGSDGSAIQTATQSHGHITCYYWRWQPPVTYGHVVLQFLPEASFGLRVLSLPASVCVCVCVCGNHLLVRTITCHPFKLESPNLDQKSKTPWLRSLLFWGLIDLELQGQI